MEGWHPDENARRIVDYLVQSGFLRPLESVNGNPAS